MGTNEKAPFFTTGGADRLSPDDEYKISSHAAAGEGRPPLSALDTWLLQKLKHEWSSCELGSILAKDKISDAVTSFPRLETPIKIRLLLSFLNMRKEEFEESKFAIVEIIDAAENDNEEWVKISAGLVKQYLFMSSEGNASDTFLHEQLAKATTTVLDTVQSTFASRTRGNDDALMVVEDFICEENAYLSPSVRQELLVKPATHFTVCEDAHSKSDTNSLGSSSGQKKSLHRPQMPRPAVRTTPSSSSASTGPSSQRHTPLSQSSHPSSSFSKKNKDMSELSYEIRRKADAGRFKRPRSRISMIDLDEVKQIESEKAQKAEEQRKKAKLAKETPPVAGSLSKDSAGIEIPNTTLNIGSGKVEVGADDEDVLLQFGANHTHNTQYNELDNAHSSGDNDSVYQQHQLPHIGSKSNNDHITGGYGTQALLNAAFHSTQDVMQEVVAQQQHSAYSNPTVRGFEPEEIHHNSNLGGFGNYGGFGIPPGNTSYSSLNDQSHGQYGGNYMEDPYQGQNQRPPGSQQGNGLGSFLDGPPPTEFWK